MQSIKLISAGLILIFLAACTPRIYGVPQDRWDLMSEQERIAAMEAYKERQIAYQQAAAERARIRAEREAARRAQLEDELRRRQERADMIYRGRAGTFGDLLEVTLIDGKIRLSGRKREYSPVSFYIADGEIKTVPIYYSRSRKAELYVFYEDRHLWFDTDPYGKNRRRAGHLIFSRDWADGITYTGINSHGRRDMRNVTVNIDVVPIRRGRVIGRRKPIVITKEKYVQPPPQIIVKEKIIQAPPQVIVKERVIEKPPEVIVKEKIVRKPPEKPRRDDRHIDQHGEKGKQHQEEGSRRQKELVGAVGNDDNGSAYGEQVKGQVEKRDRDGDNKPDKKKKIAKAKAMTARIALNGGKILVSGKYRSFHPVKFRISEGESKTIKLRGGGKSAKRQPFTARLTVSYVDGQIYFDGKPGSSSAYRVSDRRKELQLSTRGAAGMRNVKVKINAK